MLIRKPSDLRYSDVTPKSVYLDRRRFMTGLPLAVAAGSQLLSPTSRAYGAKLDNLKKSSFSTTEKMNSFQDVTTYNNFYEFGTRKDQPAQLARNFKTNPWEVSIEGAVEKPKKLSLDDLMKVAPLEERILRHRCVEAWSIVVPWIGYSLSELLKQVQPTSKAKYVAFESYFDMKQMPEWRFAGIELPYVEGLRMDEAMHPLTTVSLGLYGETLPPQNGAPIRLTVPWKYGFKSIKSIVKIRLMENEPPTTWKKMRAEEYGFYANVNPSVDHPRWSQATERRLGELFRRPTVMFNGYTDQVASLYKGMDLKKNY